MLRRRTTLRKNSPLLRKINSENPPQHQDTPEPIRKLLEPLSTIDIGEISSSESDIPNVFEEVHKNSYLHLKKNEQKHLSKYEADVLMMDQFTDLYKNTMRDLREELQIGNNLLNETYEDIVKVIESPKEQKPLLPETLNSVKNILSDPELEILSQSDQEETSNMSYDYMSGVWNMLQEHCKDKELEITPENYNAYNQLEPHWLERPSVPQEVLENSKMKCYKWLSEQHE